MSKAVTMFYDGQVFRPESPLDLEPNRRYTITLPDGPEPRPEKEEDAWDVLERLAGTVDAPPDWSEEHDHYIHGTPKRCDGAGGS
jgi:hypothetical protein